MRKKVEISILLAVLFIGTVSADVVELAGQGFIPEPNQEITVQIQTDIPLFCMETIVKVNSDANIISAMSPADCNQYGWDIDWPIDPYIDDVNNEVYFGGVSWMGEANGIVGYFKFRYNSGQVTVSIIYGFAADANCQLVEFSDKTLVFGEPDPNDSSQQSEPSQDTITDENTPAAAANPNDINLPINNYWQDKLAQRQKHLMHCPTGFDSDKETFDKADWKEQFKCEKNGGGQMLLDGEPNIIEINSDITTNQIWTANNVYWVTAPINVQALLVIEPNTVVMFGDDYGYYDCALFVNNGGTLISKGTPDKPIIYTCDFLYPDWGYYWEYLPDYGQYYFCPIYIEHTASPATTITYSFVEGAVVGIATENIALDHPIENNYSIGNLYGIGGYGTKHTDIRNNLCYYNYYSGIDIHLADVNGIGDANSVVTIVNNTCDTFQDNGITVHGVGSESDAGLVMLVNNIVSQSYVYGLNLVDGYMIGIVSNTGYYDNPTNKNWEFEEDDPVIATQNPFTTGSGYFDICYLSQNCPFINAGLEYIEQTHLIGTATDVNSSPDSNKIDIGFHHPNWNYSNAGEGDYYAGDLDKNLVVDFRDFAILANSWQQTYDISDLAQMSDNWLMTGGPEPNINPIILGDSNSGYVFVGVDGFPPNINQIAVFDNGKYLGRLYGLSEDELVALDVSESGDNEHHLKLISVNKNGHITCSNIFNFAFNCPLNYCIFPNGYESGIPLNFSAINPSDGNVYAELFADGGESVWSHTYSGTSIAGSIPADITSQHYLDYITLSAGPQPQPSPIKKPIYPKIKEWEIDPATEALIIQPDLYLDLDGCDMLNQVERAFIQNGIKFKLLGWRYAVSPLIAAYSWSCPIRYLYVLSHGGYQYDKNGGVLRTRIKLVDGVAVSVKRIDFPPGLSPSWCEELEPKLEYSHVFSWAAMNFHSLEFAYFNCCYAGRLKINAYNQLVIGQAGQIGVFDGPHSDMSYALGLAGTGRDCAFQGWYDKAWFALNGASPFNKWTLDEWSELSEGVVGGDLYTAIQYAISRQTSFLDPNAPVNTYRLKGQGLLNAIGLHD